jgi:enolase
MATPRWKRTFSRGDRIAKYNQLLRIEENLCDNAEFLGVEALSVRV